MELGELLLKDPAKRNDAVASFQESFALLKKLATDFPKEPNHRRRLFINYTSYGIGLESCGRWEEAEEAYRAALVIVEKLVGEYPHVLDDWINLGGACCNLGNALSNGGKPSESLDWFAKSIAQFDPLLDEKSPKLPVVKLYKCNAFKGRAQALDKLNRHADAVKDWDKAVELAERGLSPRSRAMRALSLLNAGRSEDAVDEVIVLTKLKGWDRAALYNFACIYSVAGTKKKTNQEQYAQRAVALLRRAIQAGYKDIPHIQSDNDLDGLRDREDFKKLMSELKEQKKESP